MEMPAAAGAIRGEWAAGPGTYRPFCCAGQIVTGNCHKKSKKY